MGGISTRTRTAIGGAGGMKLNFDAQTGLFTPGLLTGAVSGATATVLSEIGGATLSLTDIVGTFQDNEVIYQSALGSEAITAQNDRDFSSGTIGNWTLSTNGSGTLAYDTTDIGGTDDKQALLTAAGDEAYFQTKLSTSRWSVSANTFYKSTANIYVAAGNTVKQIHLTAYDFDVSYAIEPTLSGDTWTPKELYFHVASDTTGGIRTGLVGNPAAADLLYIDDISIKPVTNAALANGTVY